MAKSRQSAFEKRCWQVAADLGVPVTFGRTGVDLPACIGDARRVLYVRRPPVLAAFQLSDVTPADTVAVADFNVRSRIVLRKLGMSQHIGPRTLLSDASGVVPPDASESHYVPPPETPPAPPAFSGDKYRRRIKGLKACGGGECVVDVYSVLTAFAVTIPGVQHAVKKLLCAGLRDKGSLLQDLREARDAIDRAIEDAEGASP